MPKTDRTRAEALLDELAGILDCSIKGTGFRAMALAAIERFSDEVRAPIEGQRNVMYGRIESALNELGVPGPNHPAPIANAVDHLNVALAVCEVRASAVADDSPPADKLPAKRPVSAPAGVELSAADPAVGCWTEDLVDEIDEAILAGLRVTGKAKRISFYDLSGIRNALQPVIAKQRDDAAREARAWCALKLRQHDFGEYELADRIEAGPDAPNEEGG